MAENPTDAKPLAAGPSAEVSGTPVESFESCLEQLEKVVNELEAGDLTLERSLELFERGMGLSESCRKQLEEAETRVELLIRKEGKIVAEPFRPESAEKA
jgi:exodeoxyribonuclease VII small subunit